MDNTTEVEYISIYDRPRRGRGRPTTCTLTDEDTRQRTIEINRTYYQDNYDYCVLRQRFYKHNHIEQHTHVV